MGSGDSLNKIKHGLVAGGNRIAIGSAGRCTHSPGILESGYFEHSYYYVYQNLTYLINLVFPFCRQRGCP